MIAKELRDLMFNALERKYAAEFRELGMADDDPLVKAGMQLCRMSLNTALDVADVIEEMRATPENDRYDRLLKMFPVIPL